MSDNNGTAQPEKFLTIQQAAEALGVKAFKLDRAARRGLLPVYTVFNSRRLVRLSEVVALIESSRKGGAGAA